METPDTLRIVGIDETRLPRVLEAPYIELVFKLSRKAPLEWCQDLNLLFDKYQYSVRIDINKGLFIETWVRKIDEIEAHFELIKKRIVECNERYAQKEKDLALALLGKADNVTETQGEQGRLNSVLAKLDFN